jgi:hypothetical protein
MAIVHPTGGRELQALGAAQRELETLSYLASSLPDAYTVYHGVHWTRLQHGFSVFGEVDFVIVAPSGRVLIIEQKSGFLEETADGLFKNYGQQKKNVAVQIARSIEGIQARYAQGHGGERLRLDYILYCPNFIIAQPHIAGIEPERIVDAKRREHLARIIQSALPATDLDLKQSAAAGQFFQGVLELVPEIGAVSAEARAMYSRLSGGLATWARRLDFTPFRLRVIGTAGSGKTQLALAVLREAVAAGRRPLYVCFNRPLADHLVQLAPKGAEVLDSREQPGGG